LWPRSDKEVAPHGKREAIMAAALESTPRTIPAEDPFTGLPPDLDEFVDPDDDEDCRAGLVDRYRADEEDD
jgi:hypothetical protein